MGIGTSARDYLIAQYLHSIEKNPWQLQNRLPLEDFYNLLFERNIPESTSQESINFHNNEFLEFLRSKEHYFITLLHRCDFEDGMSNDAIVFIQQNLRHNESVTCNWLNEIYGKYLTDKLVLRGILRIVAFVRINNYDSTFVPMILASLRDTSTDCQEAALMLIEVIRSKECLDALKETTFTSPWIKEYAEGIIKELTEELTQNANQKN